MESSVTLDMTKFDELRRNLQYLSSKVVKIGVLHNPEQAWKAYQNEYGVFDSGEESHPIPVRSNIQYPIENNEGHIMDSLKENLGDFSKEDIDKSLKKAGETGLKAIDMAFDTRGYGSWKRNAPLTIALKGKDSPLIDTGELRKSYSYEVEDE